MSAFFQFRRLDVAQKKKRRRRARWKIKRVPFSIRPPKRKLALDPSAARKLAWLEDKAEERHIERMQSGREARASEPTLAQM